MLICSPDVRVVDVARRAASALARPFRTLTDPAVLPQESAIPHRLVALDLTVLQEIGREDREHLLREWLATNAGLQVVLLCPMVNPNRELRLVAELVHDLHPYPIALLVGAECVSAEEWMGALLSITGTQLRVTQGVAEHLEVIPTRWDDVSMLLRMAPQVRVMRRDITDVKALQKRLLRAGQHSPKVLLQVFRALWSSHLEELGWSRTDIAKRLGFSTPDEYSARISAVFEISKRELDTIHPAVMSRWIAQVFLARPGQAGADPRSLREFCLSTSSERVVL
jgi:hypothetical protein